MQCNSCSQLDIAHGLIAKACVCVCMQVYLQLVRMPEGNTLMDLFDQTCSGNPAVAYDFAAHVPIAAGADGPHEALPSEPLDAVETVFLLLRNECDQPVSVTVKQEIDLAVFMPVRVLQYGVQVRPACKPVNVWAMHSHGRVHQPRCMSVHYCTPGWGPQATSK